MALQEVEDLRRDGGIRAVVEGERHRVGIARVTDCLAEDLRRRSNRGPTQYSARGASAAGRHSGWNHRGIMHGQFQFSHGLRWLASASRPTLTNRHTGSNSWAGGFPVTAGAAL